MGNNSAGSYWNPWHSCEFDALFFRLRWIWRRLLLSLKVITVHPSSPVTILETKLRRRWRVQIMILLVKFYPLPCYLDPLRPKYSPQHPILKQPQPTFHPQCQKQFSHPYRTTGKITILYILIFRFLDSELENKRFSSNNSKHSLISICSYFFLNRILIH
jgi:hypothetical protein